MFGLPWQRHALAHDGPQVRRLWVGSGPHAGLLNQRQAGSGNAEADYIPPAWFHNTPPLSWRLAERVCRTGRRLAKNKDVHVRVTHGRITRVRSHWSARDSVQPVETVGREGIFLQMMEGLAAASAEPKTVMIDATYLNAHRMASSLR